MAIKTIAVHAPKPGDPDAGAGRELGHALVHYFANNLMAGGYTFALRSQLAFDDMQISTTDAAGTYLQEYVTGLGSGFLNLGNSTGVAGNILR